MDNTAITKRVQELVRPIVEGLGYKLISVAYNQKELVVTIDKEDSGVGVEDCATVSRAIDPVIEQANLIQENYQLVVSSPGIEA